jgi:hypothetical protein
LRGIGNKHTSLFFLLFDMALIESGLEAMRGKYVSLFYSLL